jgi:hypothetical protein
MTNAFLKAIGILSIAAFGTLGTMGCESREREPDYVEYRDRDHHREHREHHDEYREESDDHAYVGPEIPDPLAKMDAEMPDTPVTDDGDQTSPAR